MNDRLEGGGEKMKRVMLIDEKKAIKVLAFMYGLMLLW